MNDQEYNGHVIEDLCKLGEKVMEQYKFPATPTGATPELSGAGPGKRDAGIPSPPARKFHQLSPKEVSDGVMRELAASDRGTEAGDGE